MSQIDRNPGGLLPQPDFLCDREATGRFLDLAARLVNDLAAIARSTHLDRETDPRRVLPTIPPAVLWRIWPRALERAADLAAILPGTLPAASAEFLRDVADTIETGRPAPAIAPPIDPGEVYGYAI